MRPPIPGCSGANSPRQVGDAVAPGGVRQVTALPAEPVVPAVGFKLDSGRNGPVFTGNTMTNSLPWKYFNKINNLKFIVVDPVLSDGVCQLSVAAKPPCSSLLVEELARLRLGPPIYVTHFKPRGAEIIIEQSAARSPVRRARKRGQNQLLI